MLEDNWKTPKPNRGNGKSRFSHKPKKRCSTNKISPENRMKQFSTIQTPTNLGETINRSARKSGFQHWKERTSNTATPTKPVTPSHPRRFQEVEIPFGLPSKWGIRIGGKSEKFMDGGFRRDTLLARYLHDSPKKTNLIIVIQSCRFAIEYEYLLRYIVLL